MTDERVITKGAFDSPNLAFWDAARGEYREYHRDFRDGVDERGNRNGRDIRTSASKDFLSWPDPEWLRYSPGRVGQLYTNQVLPYYRAPHILLGFPTRYTDRGWAESTKALPQLEYRRVRGSKSQREGTAMTDGMFMSSRDGTNFDIWPEAFIRPGLRLRENWFYGDNYQGRGLVETASRVAGAADELSVYVTEATFLDHTVARFRRFTLRVDGFVSVHAKLSGGQLVTRPFVFDGGELVLNFSSSAGGGIRAEIQDRAGYAVPGFGLEDCHDLFGGRPGTRRVLARRRRPFDLGRPTGQAALRAARRRPLLAPIPETCFNRQEVIDASMTDQADRGPAVCGTRDRRPGAASLRHEHLRRGGG